MASADAMRASDGDRERVVQALQEQVGEGRLTLEEFEQRSTSVYEAKTIGDLRKLLTDLPVDVFPQPSSLGGAPWQQTFAMPATPSWHQHPVQRRAGRVHPLVLAVTVLVGLFVLTTVLGSIAFAGPLIFPLFLVFGLLRSGRGGGGRRYPPYR